MYRRLFHKPGMPVDAGSFVSPGFLRHRINPDSNVIKRITVFVHGGDIDIK
jgi:hypothetical protein